MTPEIQGPSKSLIEFTTKRPEQGVNRFCLEGYSTYGGFFHTVIGLYEKTEINGVVYSGIEIYVEPPYCFTEQAILSRILHLELPKRIQNYQQDAQTRDRLKDVFTIKGLPYSSLLFGAEYNQHHQLTTNPATLLLSIRGMTPLESLRQFQEVAHSLLSKYN